GTYEGDAVIDVDLNNPTNLLAELEQWRSDHSDIYGIVPLLPGGASEFADPSVGPNPLVEFFINQFQQLFPTLSSQISQLKPSPPSGTTSPPNPPSPCPPTPCIP
ncbi:MAG: hypothetical protein L0346_28595, partial [Chloroflexi bacterium]|nr:hypothetical protein [Chloroflexota bacterium]